MSVGLRKSSGLAAKLLEIHSEHINLKLGYADAKALERGAHELLGAIQIAA